MILKIFSVKDLKSQIFLQPFYAHQKGAAIRSITDLVSDQTHPVGKHPEDYELFEIGTYDDALGVINSLKTPEHVIMCSELKK